MTTPPSVPGTLHANPTESYYSAMTSSSSSPYLTNSHGTESQTATSQYAIPHNDNSHGSKAVNLTTQTPHSASSQSLLGPAPPLNPTLSMTPTSSLNPSAPQFVPLPESSRLSSNSGILTTPSAGGYFQSSALYMMGSQQMVYSQCPSNVGGTSVYQGTTFTGSGEKDGYQQVHSVMDVHQTRQNPYGSRSQYY